MQHKSESGVSESRLEAAFSVLVESPVEQRTQILDSLCQDDPAFRKELEELLAHDFDQFLAKPALELDTVRERLRHGAVETGRRAGPYLIREELGSGGMAVVYRGERADGKFQKQVAIKIFNRFFSASSDEERFRRELRILGHLDSPYIAQIIDAGTTEEGRPYFVMEYVDGAHIDVYCRERQLPLEARLRLFLQVCDAVTLAHNNRILHRDLKPANILVAQDGSPKLIDFGIAKSLDPAAGEPLTARGMELMTLLYASPEQLSGDAINADQPSSDVYSLGVVLYELLTGRRPLEPPPSIPLPEAPRYLLETEPVEPSKHSRSLAGDLDIIVLKALRKDRRERFQSVEQFARYIQLYLNDRPLPERAPSPFYHAKKFLKRNRVSIAAASLLLATLLGGLIATRRQEQIAQRRFEDVRRLATSFLFEFDGAIANVSGATPARQLVVSKGLEYLDKLAKESGSDDTLREELATAYERLAAIQGNVYGANLGEYQKAAASYQHALEIRNDLAKRHPSDVSLQRGLGNSHLQLADGWFTKGNTKAALAQYREGLRILEALSAQGDSSPAVQTGLQRGYSRLCNYLLASGDNTGAIENCGKSVRLSTALLAANPSDLTLRAALAAAHGQTGNALRLDKRPAEAIPELTLAAAEFEKLRAAQPENHNHPRNLAGVYSVLGSTQSALGDAGAAAQSFRHSVETMRTMISLDPADARAKTTLAVSLIRLAGVLQKLGSLPEAKAAGAEGLSIFRAFADRPQATPDDLNTYASFLSETAIPELRNPKEVLAYSLRAVSPVKEPSLVFLSTLADAYFGVGDLKNAIATAKRGLASNPKSQRGSEGIRAELERQLQMFEDIRAGKTASSLRR